MSFLRAGEHSVLEHPGQWGEDAAAYPDEVNGGGPLDPNSVPVRRRQHLQTSDLLLEGLLDCILGAVINLPDMMLREVLDEWLGEGCPLGCEEDSCRGSWVGGFGGMDSVPDG